MQRRIRKQISELLPEDFEAYPGWEYASMKKAAGAKTSARSDRSLWRQSSRPSTKSSFKPCSSFPMARHAWALSR